MRKNKTYKKRLTRYRQEKRSHDFMLGGFIIAFMLCAGSNMIYDVITEKKEGPIMAQEEIQGINTHETSENIVAVANIQKNAYSSADYEQLSDGTKLIPIKTPYFDAEVNIRLASEQACKYIGAEKWSGEKQCIEDLVGIAYAETRSFNCKSSGDSGKAKGCFQIHLGYHPQVTVAQAEDPFWAAIWTAKRLVSKGYPKYRSNSIMAHNGTPGTDKTLSYLATVNSIALR